MGRAILWFAGTAMGSLAFQLTVALWPEKLKNYAWAVKYLWWGWALCLLLWVVTHEKIFGARFKRWRDRKRFTNQKRTDLVNVSFKPSEGPSDKQFLAVTNNDEKQTFYATCELLDRRNDPNQLNKKTYDLAWVRDSAREVTLATGESCSLIIATGENSRSTHFSEVKLQGFSNGSVGKVEWSGWDEYDKKDKPQYDLRISVFGENGEKTECFTLKCGGSPSALEMVKIDCNENTAGHAKQELRETDPQVYVEIEERRGATPAKTVFVLQNHGGGIARRVQIEPLGLLSGTAVFDLIDHIGEKETGEVTPTIEQLGVFFNNHIGYLLQKEWNATAGDLVDEFVRPMRIEYENYAGRRFETAFNIVFHAVGYTLRENARRTWPWHQKRIFEVRDTKVRPLS